MKVLFLTNYPVPYRVDFFNELGKLCDLTVLFEQRIDEIFDRDQTGVAETFQTFKGVFFHGPRIKLGSYYMNFSALAWAIRTSKYDVVIFGIYSSPTQAAMITILKLLHWPYVINSDGGFIKNDCFCAKWIKRFLIGHATLYLASGEGTKQYLEYYGADPNRVKIYPLTSLIEEDVTREPVSIQRKLALRKQYGIHEKQVIIGVGQFIERKGWDVLLKAAQALPMDIGIYIVGGNETEEYQKIIAHYGLQSVHFLPFMEKKTLSDYYSLSDLFVLPTREDIWGLVINEAMAHGLPVITTKRCLAGLELIENGINGFLVESEDEEMLAIRIKQILENDELREQMKKNNQNKIQAYTIEKMATITLGALNDEVW